MVSVELTLRLLCRLTTARTKCWRARHPDTAQSIRDLHALGRWAEPREIANAILFLADEQNGFITGTILTIDGGWTAG